jgi:surfeit locus 1 family protein
VSGRARSLAAPAVATLMGLVILIGLGVWQLKRLAWKEALIAAVEARVSAPAADLPAPSDWPALYPADYEYRHVRATGVFDLKHQALVFRPLSNPRGRYGGPGYLVMTPLKLGSGESVLVNRGFVPEERSSSAASGPSGEVEVTGLMRASEGRTWFTPSDDPARKLWFTRDVESLAKALEIGPHAPFSIDADADAEPRALPQGGETILDFPNNHFSYAMTWFGTALALAGVFVAFVIRRLRETSRQDRKFAGAGDADGAR